MRTRTRVAVAATPPGSYADECVGTDRDGRSECNRETHDLPGDGCDQGNHPEHDIGPPFGVRLPVTRYEAEPEDDRRRDSSPRRRQGAPAGTARDPQSSVHA